MKSNKLNLFIVRKKYIDYLKKFDNLEHTKKESRLHVYDVFLALSISYH